jgi:hypothetical protein
VSTGTGLNVSKAQAYAVLTKPVALNVSKAQAYAVLTKPVALNVTKAQAYAVLTAVNTSPPSWGLFTFANGVVGASQTQTFSVSGASPVTFSLTSGALPSGLTLSSPGGTVGVISGTPTTAGTYTFTLTATNSYGSASQSFSITIISPGSIYITLFGVQWPSGIVGVAYSETVSVNGGTSPYTYSVLSGSLPAGLSLNTGTGVISGTPTTAGTSTFTIQAVDSSSYVGSQSFSITVAIPMPTGTNYCLIY